MWQLCNDCIEQRRQFKRGFLNSEQRGIKGVMLVAARRSMLWSAKIKCVSYTPYGADNICSVRGLPDFLPDAVNVIT